MVDRLGPYELNSVVCGECSELMTALPDNCIDLTITSPPYDNLRSYNGYTFPFEAIARQLYRVTKPGGVVVWVVADATVNGSETGSSFRQALYFMEMGFNVETMIYEVAGTGAKGSTRLYWQGFEFMFVFSKGQHKTANLICDQRNKHAGQLITGERRKRNGDLKPTKRRVVSRYSIRTNIWRMGGGDKVDMGHPAPFPEALARDHIISWSNPNDIVFDPMAGSGTTLKMAKQNGRRWLGFEISEEYCALARRRVELAQPPLFVLESETVEG